MFSSASSPIGSLFDLISFGFVARNAKRFTTNIPPKPQDFLEEAVALLDFVLYKSGISKGGGFGKLLLAACENWMAERKLNWMWTSFNSRNESAFRFYERTGFEPFKE